jgi:hypothetical protein
MLLCSVGNKVKDESAGIERGKGGKMEKGIGTREGCVCRLMHCHNNIPWDIPWDGTSESRFPLKYTSSFFALKNTLLFDEAELNSSLLSVSPPPSLLLFLLHVMPVSTQEHRKYHSRLSCPAVNELPAGRLCVYAVSLDFFPAHPHSLTRKIIMHRRAFPPCPPFQHRQVSPRRPRDR